MNLPNHKNALTSTGLLMEGQSTHLRTQTTRRAALSRSSSASSSPISISRKKTLKVPGVINSNANSSKRNTSLMKTLFLCQLMSPLLFTLRRRRPFGYVNSGILRGSRTELGWYRFAGTWL